VTQNWTSNVIGTGDPEDPGVKTLVSSFVSDPAYQGLINQPIFYTSVPIVRNYNGDNLMGKMIDDAIYNYLNQDGDPGNDVDMMYNNAGGLRADIACAVYPCAVTYGMSFTVLPFGNATVVGTMSGAQILELLNQSATLFKGALQMAGIRHKFYRYQTTGYTWAWGAYDVEVWDKQASTWAALDLKKNYRVATNEFLAPAGGDGFSAFKYMTNLSYWGEMLDQVNHWMGHNYPLATPYNLAVDGRITREGDDASGPVIPVTLLHHNDSHGYLLKSGTTPGYSQLVTLIKQERQYNPSRTLLLNAGDFLQGDPMMYYFRTAPKGYAGDGTALDPSLQINPLIKAFNLVGYDAVTLGNHEFNFGNLVFVNNLALAAFPLLQANISDAGPYGLSQAGVLPYTVRTIGGENIRVALLGIGNHRVPHFEIPTNIPGLTFSDPITVAQTWAPSLQQSNDAVVALTHIGFTENPANKELDDRVDTRLADQVSGLDAVIGGHSHTDPSRQTTASGSYEYLPTILAGPGNTPVAVAQAYRYNTYLGEVVLGFKPKPGGYQVVSRTGRYLAVSSGTAEDADIVNLGAPYRTRFDSYLAQGIGQTAVPIDALSGFTQETNGANLEADASIFKLNWLGIPVDFHLSGAMANRQVAGSASVSAPATLTVNDAFSLMPYDYSLVVVRLNGPQLKAIPERSYRNYYYYKYVPGYGDYSYSTACLLDISGGGRIVYRDSHPGLPDGHNLLGLFYRDAAQVERQVNFDDPSTFYRVSTLNYLVSGACNFNDNGATLWPLTQIEQDTSFSLRDAVIDYLRAQPGPVSPAVEGRLQYLQITTFPIYLPIIMQ
jgi:2',3'-cyclic-nucleotide 2'-phosphodiesterase (5'-nucleotidase family)